MSDVFRNIQELKKNVVKREAEKKEMEDVVERENLREIRKFWIRQSISWLFERRSLIGEGHQGQEEVRLQVKGGFVVASVALFVVERRPAVGR